MKPGRPAIFLDRDGTLNVEVDYLGCPEDVVLIPGASGAVAELNRRGVPVVVVTNQAGIARGKFSWQDYEAVAARVAELLAVEGARLDGVYACPFHENGIEPFRHPDHPERKPNPGLLQKAATDLDLDLTRSWMIGDKASDLEAGRRAGCRTVLVRTGYGRETDASKADLVAEDLPEAVRKVLVAWP